jgi:uncharacterized protein YceH (UPF0502 family)
MSFQLNDVEVRVLGALIEKDMATPEYYPLSLNALVNACNQKSNRDPVVSYDEQAVEEAIEALRAKNLAMVTTGGEHRVPKHSHRISETLNLGNRELAVLCALMLRGPQTAGELKGRTQRLHEFDDLGGVESCLSRLMEREPEPLVVRLPRQPGAREHRYAHLLSGEVQVPEQEPPGRSLEATARPDPMLERVARLEAEFDSLKQDLRDLERQFADFRRQFE